MGGNRSLIERSFDLKPLRSLPFAQSKKCKYQALTLARL
jgi:hypothetical protein